MRILCCRLSFYSVILRALIYLFQFIDLSIKEELKALHNLRKQKHLVIQKADNGSTVVITEKNVYINKMK